MMKQFELMWYNIDLLLMTDMYNWWARHWKRC